MVRHWQYARDGCRGRWNSWITVIEHVDQIRRPLAGYGGRGADGWRRWRQVKYL